MLQNKSANSSDASFKSQSAAASHQNLREWNREMGKDIKVHVMKREFGFNRVDMHALDFAYKFVAGTHAPSARPRTAMHAHLPVPCRTSPPCKGSNIDFACRPTRLPVDVNRRYQWSRWKVWPDDTRHLNRHLQSQSSDTASHHPRQGNLLLL